MATPSFAALLLGAVQVHNGRDVSVNISADTEHLMQSDVAARMESENKLSNATDNFASIVWGG